jgi:hypothetical protein
MLKRLTAAFTLGALVALGAVPAAAVATPSPAPTPLKTITHIHSSPLCTGLRRAIAPAIGRVLQSDRLISASKPMFHDYVRASATQQSKAAQDMAVMHLEQLITPLVKNTQEVDNLLNNPYAFPKTARSQDEKRLLQMRAQLQAVNDQQKKALDVISGFVDTQQLGELQAEGHEYDAAINNTGQRSPPPNPAPSAAPNEVLNAGLDTSKDPARQMDPRYLNSDSTLGNNPLNVFENAIVSYQHDIQSSEQDAAKSVVQAVPLCGGEVPGQTTPSPSPTASP